MLRSHGIAYPTGVSASGMIQEGLFVLHFSPFLLIKLIVHFQLKEDIIKMMAGN